MFMDVLKFDLILRGDLGFFFDIYGLFSFFRIDGVIYVNFCNRYYICY